MAARIRHQHTTKPAHNRSARKKAAAHTSSAKSRGRRKSATSERWSQRVTKHSNALDLKQRVFTLHDPKKIAASLKRSAERSTLRKGKPLSLRAVDADVLYQSRRQGLAEDSA
jgi:hypothetical protein